MVHGKKYINNDVVFTHFKKHYCPDCKTKVVRVKVSKIVNSESSDAKKYDFSNGIDGSLIGNIKFVWTEFECPMCKRHFTVDEIKRIESQLKRK